MLSKHPSSYITATELNYVDHVRGHYDCLYQALEIRVREEQRMMDEKIVVEMDQKVIDQQNTLEMAGVPGFYITTNPQVNQHFVNVHSCAYGRCMKHNGSMSLCAST